MLCWWLCGCSTGDLLLTDNSRATVVILASDDAYGVFSFDTPDSNRVEEGSTIFYEYAALEWQRLMLPLCFLIVYVVQCSLIL